MSSSETSEHASQGHEREDLGASDESAVAGSRASTKSSGKPSLWSRLFPGRPVKARGKGLDGSRRRAQTEDTGRRAVLVEDPFDPARNRFHSEGNITLDFPRVSKPIRLSVEYDKADVTGTVTTQSTTSNNRGEKNKTDVASSDETSPTEPLEDKGATPAESTQESVQGVADTAEQSFLAVPVTSAILVPATSSEDFQATAARRDSSVSTTREQLVQQQDELEEKIEMLEQERKQIALDVVKRLQELQLENNEGVDVYNALTPSQVALMYTTLQCAPPSSLVAQKRAQFKKYLGDESPKKAVAQLKPSSQGIKLASEELVLSYAYNSNVTSPQATLLQNFTRQHDQQLYPQSQTSLKLKRSFWEKSATVIQRAWRRYRQHQIIAWEKETVELGRNHVASPSAKTSLKIPSYAQFRDKYAQHRPASASWDNREGSRSQSLVGNESIVSTQPSLKHPAQTPRLGKSDRGLLLTFYQVLKSGDPSQVMTLSKIVSILRQCRAHMQKSQFDVLLDAVIKGILRHGGNLYTPCHPSCLVDLAEKYLAVEGNTLAADLIQLATEFEAMSIDGLVCLGPMANSNQNFHPVDGLTSNEVLLLTRLFNQISAKCRAPHHRVRSAEVATEADLFVGALAELRGVQRDTGKALYDYLLVSSKMPGLVVASDLTRFVQRNLRTKDTYHIALNVLRVAFEYGQNRLRASSRASRASSCSASGRARRFSSASSFSHSNQSRTSSMSSLATSVTTFSNVSSLCKSTTEVTSRVNTGFH